MLVSRVCGHTSVIITESITSVILLRPLSLSEDLGRKNTSFVPVGSCKLCWSNDILPTCHLTYAPSTFYSNSNQGQEQHRVRLNESSKETLRKLNYFGSWLFTYDGCGYESRLKVAAASAGSLWRHLSFQTTWFRPKNASSGKIKKFWKLQPTTQSNTYDKAWLRTCLTSWGLFSKQMLP